MEAPKEVSNHAVVPVDPESFKGEKSSVTSAESSHDNVPIIDVPLRFKIGAILLVSAIGFGGHWSSGVTGALKSTLKTVKKLRQISLFVC